MAYEDIKSTNHRTQDVFAEAEEHYTWTKTCIMDHLRDLESPDTSRISSYTSPNNKITCEGNEDLGISKINFI